MKKIFLSVILSAVSAGFLFAQDEEEQKGFKKENLFTGGSITASFYSGGTILGANPIFGYKIANWLDAGIALNYTYQGSRDNFVFDDRIRQHVFGPGVFTRIYPVPFLFLHAQAEHNFNNWSYSAPNGNKQSDVTDANSLLLGGGWAQGRQRGSNSFFYIEVLFDVLKNKNSPYVNNVYDSYTNEVLRTDAVPIFRMGLNVALFQGKYRNSETEPRGNGHKQPRNYSNL